MIRFILAFALWCVSSLALLAQGSESFENPAFKEYSYHDTTWVGDNGMQWRFVDTRTDQWMDGRALCVRAGVVSGQLTPEQKAAGVGTISLSYMSPYIEKGKEFTLALTVGGTTVKLLDAVVLEKEVRYELVDFPVNATGDSIVLKLTSVKTGARLRIDNLTWTAADQVAPDASTLAAPMAYDATHVTSSGFTAHWRTVTHAESYKVTVFSEGGDTLLTTDATPDDAYAVQSLAPATSYSYDVVAYADGLNHSAPSNRIQFVTKSMGTDDDLDDDIMAYYHAARGESDAQLLLALRTLINTGVNDLDYSPDIWTTCMEANEDPDNENNVILFYSGYSVPKEQKGTGGNLWNREHCWPQSLGGDYEDAHHIMPADNKVNSSRNNSPYAMGGDSVMSSHGITGSLRGDDTFEPRDEVKGDVARMIMYMVCRYPEKAFGTVLDKDLALEWHREDPVDDFERNRNAILYTYQNNRNPFIDNPELAEYLWGDKQGIVWGIATSVEDAELSDWTLWNSVVTDGKLKIMQASNEAMNYTIYSPSGQAMQAGNYMGSASISVCGLPHGMYLMYTTNGMERKQSKFFIQ